MNVKLFLLVLYEVFFLSVHSMTNNQTVENNTVTCHDIENLVTSICNTSNTTCLKEKCNQMFSSINNYLSDTNQTEEVCWMLEHRFNTLRQQMSSNFRSFETCLIQINSSLHTMCHEGFQNICESMDCILGYSCSNQMEFIQILHFISLSENRSDTCNEPTNAMTATQTTEIDFNDEEDNTTTTTHETTSSPKTKSLFTRESTNPMITSAVEGIQTQQDTTVTTPDRTSNPKTKSLFTRESTSPMTTSAVEGIQTQQDTTVTTPDRTSNPKTKSLFTRESTNPTTTMTTMTTLTVGVIQAEQDTTIPTYERTSKPATQSFLTAESTNISAVDDVQIISTTTQAHQSQYNDNLKQIEDFANNNELTNDYVSKVTEADVQEISNQLNDLLTNIENSPESLRQANDIARIFPNILRRTNFSSNSSREINIKTRLFAVQVALADTRIPFKYNSSGSSDGGVSIPSDILKLVAERESGGSDVIVVISEYFNNQLFQSDENVSTIYSIDIGRDSNYRLTSLSTPVQIMFSQFVGEEDISAMNLTCAFWDFSLRTWLSDGCRLSQQSPPSCECDHTTNFALLVKPNLPADFALSIVSTIGFVLSIVGLLATLAIHIIHRELRRRRPSIILMHICFNLCVGYIIFLTGVEHATWNENLCIATAFFLQFFFLASWGWMTVYSYDLYLSVVKIFHSKKTFFLRKFGSVAYTMAILISVITLSVGLGINKDSDEKSTYLADNICWLSQYPLLLGFFLPILIMLSFNQYVFVRIFRELFNKQKKVLSSAKKRTAEQQFMVAVTMVCFTGLAWIFAFLLLASDLFNSQGYETTFSWLFVIFNTLQGFGIFLLTTIKAQEARKFWWHPLRSKLTGVSSTTMTSSFKSKSIENSDLIRRSTKRTLVDSDV